MERWSGKVALVTGASEGIGAAIVKALVKHGVQVLGCARNLEKLKELGSSLEGPGSFRPVQCDVTKEDEILKMFEIARQEYRGLHILVNNAGLAHTGYLVESKTEDLREMMEVNVIALTVCAREAVKLMREFGIDDGNIININSCSGHRVAPGILHFYTATKFAVTALTLGLRSEVGNLGTHIRVSQISPGVVETEFAKKANKSEEVQRALYSSMKCLEPEDVAASVVHVLSAPAYCGIVDVLMFPVEQEYSAPLKLPK